MQVEGQHGSNTGGDRRTGE